MESSLPDSELCGYVLQATGAGVWTWDVVADDLSADARCHEIIAAAGALDHERRKTVFRAAAEAAVDFDYEHRLTTTDGDPLWLRLCGRALRDERGEVVRCVGLMRDVTDEHDLRDSEARLRFVVSATHDGLWELDVPTGRVWGSDEMLATLGLARERCPRDLDAALALVHPDDRPLARAGIASLVAGRSGPGRAIVRMRRGAGDWREIESWAVLETDPESGDATRLMGIVQDRTDTAGRDDWSRDLARRLNEGVLAPLEVAARHVKLAAVALGSSAGEAGGLIDVSSVHLGRARDGMEAVIQSLLLRSFDAGD
jgi:PAS domain-containing protein